MYTGELLLRPWVDSRNWLSRYGEQSAQRGVLLWVLWHRQRGRPRSVCITIRYWRAAILSGIAARPRPGVEKRPAGRSALRPA